MKHCTQCGHVLGLGRFCTNCGHPVASRHADPLNDPLEVADAPSAAAENPPADDQDWRVTTAERGSRPRSSDPVNPAHPAERRAVPVPVPAAPRVPPAVIEPPTPPRFPLFADELPATAAVADPTQSSALGSALVSLADPVEATVDADDEDEYEDWEDWDEDGGRSRMFWVVAGIVVLAVLVIGAWFLGTALGGDDGAEADDPAASSGQTDQAQKPVDHTAEASAVAPETAPPNEDVDGNPTSYDASNMLDGVPETTWRAEGDGSGFKLVFTFAEKTRITEVGLINGYAKKARDGGKVLDWYEGHRRIESVTWNFGVGPFVRQDLEDDRAMQTIDIEPVEVRKIVLKIVTTTDPGDGAARRDFTAISDVLLAGTPG